MHLIHHALEAPRLFGGEPVPLKVDRRTLAKRRWRGVAEDGAEFGFDLHEPLADGVIFAEFAGVAYRLVQQPESVLEIAFRTDPSENARLGWMIGNLHFSMAVGEGKALVEDDPALRQLFAREHIPFLVAERVFRPIAPDAAAHGHDHHHPHG